MKSRSKSTKRARKKRVSARRGTTASRVKARSAPKVPVTVVNFQRAESHMYFAKAVQDGAFGCLGHHRAPVAIDAQEVIRMNRDTLYSFGVFDLDGGPVTIELPDVGGRYMSLLMIDEDHYTHPSSMPRVLTRSLASRSARATCSRRFARSQTLAANPTSKLQMRRRIAFACSRPRKALSRSRAGTRRHEMRFATCCSSCPPERARPTKSGSARETRSIRFNTC